jgi:hypothetical protein
MPYACVAAETDTSRMLSTPILFIYRFVSDIHGIISSLTNLTVPLVQRKIEKIQTFSPLWSEVIQQTIPLRQYGNFLDRARLLTQKLLPSATSNQQEHNNDVNNNNNLNK